jgi:biotin operon repressor
MKTSTQERWAEWQRLLDAGTYSTKAELTRAEGVSRAAVTRALQRLRRSR